MTTVVTQMRELSGEELDLVSGGKTQSIHGGFKFTLHDDGNLTISAGIPAVTFNSKGEVEQVRSYAH